MATTESTDFMARMFTQAADTFNETMQTGLKFQEQAAKFWTGTLTKNADQVRTQFEKVSEEAIPTAKKNLEQFHQTFEDQAKKSMDVLRRTFDNASGWADNGLQEQTTNLWRTSFDSMRSSVDVVAKANAEMFESWSASSREANVSGKANGKSSK